MLNKRQKLMIRDLEKTLIPVNARQLSEKYGVSLRTVRNDINDIADYLKDQNADFIRIPGQGMRIVSEADISARFDQVLRNRDFPYLDSRQRSILLLLNFIFTPEPLSTADLCDAFDVSKGTVISAIKQANRLYRELKMRIVRHQNKGYCLDASLKNIVNGCGILMRQEGEELICNTLTCPENGFISEDDKDRLEQTLQYISNDLSLYITHHLFLSFMLYCVVCRSAGTKRGHIHSENDSSKFCQLASYLEDQFSIRLNRSGIAILRHILSNSTDYSAHLSGSDNDSSLQEAVDDMIDFVNGSGMYQINDSETLKADLVIHLKSAIEAIGSGLPRDNPLLDEIRNTYPNEFNLIKSAAQRFSGIYPVKLDDDEVGYLTLYFLRSFDRTEKIQETRVMVVCNTGRSASKLLATRLINNIPDIHIVSMSSIYNIDSNPDILDNVDFVISTIPITSISKPYVVISPLLQKHEIGKVKEAIWLSKSEIQLDEPVDAVAESMLEEQRRIASDPYSNLNEYRDVRNIIPFNATTLLGEVSMNLFYLISDLYPKGIPISAFGNVSGIYAHVLMSVPRWQRNEFIEPHDDEPLIKEHKKQYEAIRKYLQQESERLGIMIPESEIIAILRYYVY